MSRINDRSNCEVTRGLPVANSLPPSSRGFDLLRFIRFVIPSAPFVVPSAHIVTPRAHFVVPRADIVIPSPHFVVPSAHHVIPSEARNLGFANDQRLTTNDRLHPQSCPLDCPPAFAPPIRIETSPERTDALLLSCLPRLSHSASGKFGAKYPCLVVGFSLHSFSSQYRVRSARNPRRKSRKPQPGARLGNSGIKQFNHGPGSAFWAVLISLYALKRFSAHDRAVSAAPAGQPKQNNEDLQ